MANQSERGGSGNFANDPQKASEAGRKGGQQSQQSGSQSKATPSDRSGSQHEQTDGPGGAQQGGSRTFANDPEKASEAGRKGGQQSHGGNK